MKVSELMLGPAGNACRFDGTVPEWLTGLGVWEANPKIVEKLRELGVLLATETIRHSYPHDWRMLQAMMS